MNIELIKRQAKERFAAYTADYDLSQPKMALKAKHTYKVAQLCEEIARAEGLSEEDILVAWMCGLLHDIGRFEQVTRFDTFYDSESVDHAHLSYEILFGTDSVGEDQRCFPDEKLEPMIREFIPEDTYDNEIGKAIWWHAAFRYPESLTEREKLFAGIIRDADKIDILRVNLETPLSQIHNLPEEEFYSSEVTPEVFQAFKEHHCVLRSIKKTPIDNVVSYISLFWELEFLRSREIAIEQGYLAQLANFQSKNKDTLAVFSEIRKELGLE